MATPQMERRKSIITKADLESVARKFNDFIGALPAGERLAITSLLQRPELHGQFTTVIAGQADGILVTLGPHGITVGGPIGPHSTPLVIPGENAGG